MLPLMNYQNNQYQQPMYQNPYMDNRMNYLQQYQQSISPTQMSGTSQGMVTRIVDNFESITANDVPMNGGAIFIKNDGSELQWRAWHSDGTIKTSVYLPQKSILDEQTIKSSTEEEKSKFDTFNEVLEGIQTKVDMLSDKIDEILKQKTTTRGKKEVASDE